MFHTVRGILTVRHQSGILFDSLQNIEILRCQTIVAVIVDFYRNFTVFLLLLVISLGCIIQQELLTAGCLIAGKHLHTGISASAVAGSQNIVEFLGKCTDPLIHLVHVIRDALIGQVGTDLCLFPYTVIGNSPGILLTVR